MAAPWLCDVEQRRLLRRRVIDALEVVLQVDVAYPEDQPHVVSPAAAARLLVQVSRRRRRHEEVVVARVELESSRRRRKRAEREGEVGRLERLVADGDDLRRQVDVEPTRLELVPGDVVDDVALSLVDVPDLVGAVERADDVGLYGIFQCLVAC